MRYPMILRAGTWLVAVCAVALAACDQAPTDSATLVGTEIAASGGSWDYKVNGGGEMLANGPIFIQVSVSDTEDGSGVKGEVEYDARNLDGTVWFKWHAKVDGFAIGEDASGNTVVNLCGEVSTMQEGSHSNFYVGAPVGIAIKDVADGVDRMRQNGDVITCELGAFYGDTETTFPAEMVDGDFRVKDRTN